MARKGPAPLRLHYVFYALGVIFLFATIVYFAREYVLNLSNVAKTIILCCLVIAFFFGATLLDERGI